MKTAKALCKFTQHILNVCRVTEGDTQTVSRPGPSRVALPPAGTRMSPVPGRMLKGGVRRGARGPWWVVGRFGACVKFFTQLSLEQCRGWGTSSHAVENLCNLQTGVVQGLTVFLVSFSCLEIRIVLVCILLYKAL